MFQIVNCTLVCKAPMLRDLGARPQEILRFEGVESGSIFSGTCVLE